MGNLQHEKPDISPFDMAMYVLEQVKQSFGADIAELADLDLVRCLINVNPGIEPIVDEKCERVFYEVNSKAAINLSVAATGQPEVFEVVREICAANALNGRPIPEPLRAISFKLLKGTYVPPKRAGPMPGKDFGLFWLAVSTAWFLKDAYGIPLTRGDGMAETSAADAVVEALNRHAVACRYTRVRDWLDHHKHAQNRVRARVVRDQIRENYLFELGVLTPRSQWWIGPYGPSGPLSKTRRMPWERIDGT